MLLIRSHWTPCLGSGALEDVIQTHQDAERNHYKLPKNQKSTSKSTTKSWSHFNEVKGVNFFLNRDENLDEG